MNVPKPPLAVALLAALTLGRFAGAGEPGGERRVDSAEPSPWCRVLPLRERGLPAPAQAAVGQRVALMQARRVERVDDAQVPDWDAVSQGLRPSDTPLSVAPRVARLRGLNGESMGWATAGVNVGGVWSGALLAGRHDRWGRWWLEAVDLAWAGGDAVFTQELMNAEVGGSPATLVRKEGGSGRAMASLSWCRRGLLYTLRVPQADDAAVEALSALARELARLEAP